MEKILYLSRSEVEKLDVPISEIIRAVENAFLEKSKGLTEVPPKPGIHPKKDSFIHAMPAYLSKTAVAGVKWVSGFTDNPKNGLPYISGLLVLNNLETGFPICVMDCTWITAKRTGAATAVAAKYLARKDSQTLGILGCGAQGRSNLDALKTAFRGLKLVKAYDINEHNLQRYVEEMSAKYRLKISPCNSPREAVEDCDIVVTAGPILKNPKPVIEPEWFTNGGFACPLDFDSYWKPETMHSVDKFCTDDREQLSYYRSQGYFHDIPNVYAELSQLVSLSVIGREEPKERIMSMHLGSALADMATAKLVYEKAKKSGIGQQLTP